MLRVHAFYLYQLGLQIHPVGDFPAGFGRKTTWAHARHPLIVAEGALQVFLNQSIYRPQTAYQDGDNLLAQIRATKTHYETLGNPDQELDFMDVYQLQDLVQRFESVVAAEFGMLELYKVGQKGGYNTSDLIVRGETLFPADLPIKVPAALFDVREATKCLAFELPTACAFHLHRANESVLHRYYDAVTGGAKRPKSRNMGDYLNSLSEKNMGNQQVRTALRDVKDLHRNPLIHPEHSLETVDEAIDLLGAIRSLIGFMLREIPAPTNPVTSAGLSTLMDAPMVTDIEATSGIPVSSRSSRVKKKGAPKRAPSKGRPA